MEIEQAVNAMIDSRALVIHGFDDDTCFFPLPAIRHIADEDGFFGIVPRDFEPFFHFGCSIYLPNENCGYLFYDELCTKLAMPIKLIYRFLSHYTDAHRSPSPSR